MKKKSLKIKILLGLFVFFLSQNFCWSEEPSKSILAHSEEVFFKVSLQDIDFEGDEIIVYSNNKIIPVSSIRNVEGQWFASRREQLRYCPRMHPLCLKCGLCHIKSCTYYVDPEKSHK